MKLQNTKHLISSVRLTVICLIGNDHILPDKLLSALNSDGNVCAAIINLDERLTAVKTDAALNNKFGTYSSYINDLVTFAEQGNEHLLATVTLDKVANIRSIYFRVAEELKDKVYFVRFVQDESSDIRLQLETGENAWQYILYRLDDNGNLKEVDL